MDFFHVSLWQESGSDAGILQPHSTARLKIKGLRRKIRESSRFFWWRVSQAGGRRNHGALGVSLSCSEAIESEGTL